MALYYVLPRCKVFKPGTYVEGIENETQVQAIDVMQDEGRLCPMGYKGIVVPMHLVRNDLVRIQKRGLDFQNRW